MKIKIVAFLIILGLFAIGCSDDNKETKEEKRIREEVTSGLMGKKWVNEVIKTYENDTVKIKRSLVFGETSVRYTYHYDSIANNEYLSETYENGGYYSISKNGKTINIIMDGGPFLLDYSPDKLSGYWENNYVVFIIE